MKETIKGAIAGAVITGTAFISLAGGDSQEITRLSTPKSASKEQVWSVKSIDNVQERMDTRLEVLYRVKTSLEARLVDNPTDMELLSEQRNVNNEIASLEAGKEEISAIEDVVKGSPIDIIK